MSWLHRYCLCKALIRHAPVLDVKLMQVFAWISALVLVGAGTLQFVWCPHKLRSADDGLDLVDFA